MASRDQISIGSQSILWVAGVGVALLTLAFVMGVQVGKQSAALHRPANASGNEDLEDLPEPLVDQLKVFAGDGSDKLVPTRPVDASAPPPPAAASPAAEDASIAAESEQWTLQLLATSDATEAKKLVDRARDAGFATTLVHAGGKIKVRLAASGDRAAMDATAAKLKKAGFRPFPVKLP